MATGSVVVRFPRLLPMQHDPPISLDAAYRRYFPAIREKCRRMLSDADEAQDVAQETFVRLWSSGQVTLAPEQVLLWAYRTSTHLAIDRLRRRALQTKWGHQPSAEAAMETQAAVIDARTVLRGLATRLPARDLELLMLERVDGLTQSEVAEVVGTSHRTVRRWFSRAYRRLQLLKVEFER